MEICYDNDFWIDFEILMFDRDRMDKTKDDVKNFINLLSINANSKVLDVCCGFGRHSNIIAKNNINVTGIDITKPYLDRAIKNAPTPENPTYILQDILTFNHKEKYTHALNLFTSFGLLESEEDEIIGIRNIYNSLEPGGKYLIDIQGKELLCRDFEPNIWFESSDIKVLFEYKILNAFTTLRSRWIYIKNNEIYEKSFDTRIYSALEISRILTDVGFKSIDVYGDFLGNPYNMEGKRLVVVATK